MATFDVAKLLNKITQDIPGINTVLKALAKWDVSALTDVPDGAMQATTDTNNRLTIKKKVSGSYTPVAKLMHDVDQLDGYHASTSATANAIAVRNSSGALPGNITGNAATANTASALAAGAVVPVNQGGTGATTASQARTNLGVAGSSDFTSHIAKQASLSVEGHVKLDALAADGSNTAAPGGYGLGNFLSPVTDFNNCVVNGWYCGSTSTANKPPISTSYHVFVQAINTTNVLQKAYRLNGVGCYTRVRLSGVWSEWVLEPKGITDSTSTTSSNIAASATAVKAAYDRAQQVATASITGGVKVGGAISSVSSDGTVTLSSATTTSRGICRVATLADMEPDAVIENGPAFLAVGSDAVTTTPTPNTIMRRDEAGRVQVEAPAHDKDVANKEYVDNLRDVTGSITLNGTTDNTVVMTGIVTELALEIGDVIRIDTGAHNKLHTVESITNNSSIIVNYEHAGNRGNGSLKLPNFTGQATVTRIAKWFNAPIGLGQAWVVVTGRRAIGTNYINSTGRAIKASVEGTFSSAKGYALFVNGVSVVTMYNANSAAMVAAIECTVIAGATYKIVPTGVPTYRGWVELR